MDTSDHQTIEPAVHDSQPAAPDALPQFQPMSLHEKLQLRMESLELEKQGKLEEAQRVKRHIPMPPYLAKFAKEHLGADFLIKYGWNLSEADAEYGSGWLTK
jgi:hypothetical protein